jgi:prevent-host-death family protein
MAKKKTYSVAQARANLPAILNEVGAGHEVYLTRRGETAAVVVSTARYESLRGKGTTFDQAYGEFLRRRSLADIDLDPSYFDSLRDRSPGRKVRL